LQLANPVKPVPASGYFATIYCKVALSITTIKYQNPFTVNMNHATTHYLAKSRQVLELNDVGKLDKLLIELRAELSALQIGFGSKRMTHTGSGREPVKNKKAIRNTRRSIARILTRKNQLKQQARKANE